MSQATFLNRQALYLRPDPARVVVRPFKPATEPRDLNPTDKTRANHIVERVLALDPGRPRASWPMSSRISRAATATCWRPSRRAPTRWKTPSPRMRPSRKVQRQLVGAYFLHEYSFEASALFNPSIVAHPDQSGAPEGGTSLHPQPSRGRRGPYLVPDVSIGTIAADGSVSVDPTARLAAIPKVSSRASGCRRRRDRGRPSCPTRIISERVIFPVTDVPVERHRGCPLRGIRRRRRRRPSMRPTRPIAARRSDPS